MIKYIKKNRKHNIQEMGDMTQDDTISISDLEKNQSGLELEESSLGEIPPEEHKN